MSLLGTFATAEQTGTFVPDYGGWGNTSQATIFSGPLEFNITGNDVVSSVPEPSLGLLSGLLLIGAGVIGRRRRS